MEYAAVKKKKKEYTVGTSVWIGIAGLPRYNVRWKKQGQNNAYSMLTYREENNNMYV